MLKQPRTWLDWARFYLHAFRLVVVTVCLGLAVYGWFGHIGWLYPARHCHWHRRVARMHVLPDGAGLGSSHTPASGDQLKSTQRPHVDVSPMRGDPYAG